MEMEWLAALQGASMICGAISLVFTLVVGWLLIKGVKMLAAKAEENDKAAAAENTDAASAEDDAEGPQGDEGP